MQDLLVVKACVGALFDSLRECVQLIDPQCDSGALALSLRERVASTRSHSSDGSGSQSSLLSRVPENEPVTNSVSGPNVGQVVTRLPTSREAGAGAARHAINAGSMSLALPAPHSHPHAHSASRAHPHRGDNTAGTGSGSSFVGTSNPEMLNGNGGPASTPSASSQFANFFASLNLPLLSRTTTSSSGVKSSKSSSKAQMASSSLRLSSSKDGGSRSGRNSVHQPPAAPVIAGVGSTPVGSGPAFVYR